MVEKVFGAVGFCIKAKVEVVLAPVTVKVMASGVKSAACTPWNIPFPGSAIGTVETASRA
jgi:hypothetical protein